METLNPKLVRLVLLMLAGAALISGIIYVRQQLQYRQLEKQQAAAGKQAAASQQTGQAAHGQYLIDSTRLATERDVLRSRQPGRLVLPETPPKEL